MSQIKCSVVIGCYNQLEPLKQVLPEYSKQSISKDLFEVILVDSTSTDGSLDFYKAYEVDYNLVVHVQENKGKVGARNKGVALAKGAIILITDADMIPDPDLIKEHITAHETANSLSCFQGYAQNISHLEWPISSATLSPQVGSNPKHMAKLGWYYFLTGNLSMPKILFEKEEGFNYAFQGYGWEDLELGYRLYKKKVPLYYLKSAKNFHYHVITKDEEIERNVGKGKSAQTFLKLHPELKWFLGGNPVSLYLYKRIKKSGAFYQRMQQWYKAKQNWQHKFAFWFLKEHQYLSGFLSK